MSLMIVCVFVCVCVCVCVCVLGIQCCCSSCCPHFHLCFFCCPTAVVFRRRALPELMTFTPSSPSELSVQLRGAALTADDVVGAVTFDDLVAPVFLQCPPHESDRTFRVGVAGTRAEATLPAMAVYDAVDRTPTVEYPFDRRNFSAIGEASKGACRRGVEHVCVRVCICVCVCVAVYAFLRCYSTICFPLPSSLSRFATRRVGDSGGRQRQRALVRL